MAKIKHLTSPTPDYSEERPLTGSGTARHSRTVTESAESLSLAMAPLTDDQLSQFGLSISVFGNDTVCKTLNGHWQFRKIGMEQVSDFLSSGSGDLDFLKATFELLGVTLEDSREQCSKLSARIIEQLIETSKEKSVLFSELSKHFGSIITKTTDLNPRIQKVLSV